MKFPTIHMNGTGAQTLLDDYQNAMHFIQDAMDAIRRIEFNSRDYYPQGNNAWEQARDEMNDRIISLNKIHNDFLAICENILSQDKR